jgi:hypothetical protein
LAVCWVGLVFSSPAAAIRTQLRMNKSAVVKGPKRRLIWRLPKEW